MGLRRKKSENDYGFEEERQYESKGNIGTFFSGILIFLIGAYLIFQNVVVSSSFGFSRYLGFEPPFGLVLLPLIIGVIVLFFSENSLIGWFLIVFGIIIILLGVLMGLRIRFMETTLFITILMYGMTAAGMGITLKGLYGKNKK